MVDTTNENDKFWDGGSYCCTHIVSNMASSEKPVPVNICKSMGILLISLVEWRFDWFFSGVYHRFPSYSIMFSHFQTCSVIFHQFPSVSIHRALCILHEFLPNNGARWPGGVAVLGSEGGPEGVHLGEGAAVVLHRQPRWKQC